MLRLQHLAVDNRVSR